MALFLRLILVLTLLRPIGAVAQCAPECEPERTCCCVGECPCCAAPNEQPQAPAPKAVTAEPLFAALPAIDLPLPAAPRVRPELRHGQMTAHVARPIRVLACVWLT